MVLNNQSPVGRLLSTLENSESPKSVLCELLSVVKSNKITRSERLAVVRSVAKVKVRAYMDYDYQMFHKLEHLSRDILEFL